MSLNGVRQGTPWLARGKDNLGNFLEKGYQTNNNVSINATGDAYNLRFSASQSYQKSYIPNNNLSGFTLNMYGAYKPTDKLKLEGNFNYNRQYSDQFPDVAYGPNSLIYNIAIWGGADWDINDMKDYWQPGKVGVQSKYAEYERYHNPYFMVNEWLRGH
ncbi:MAG: SusC/RagA family TonB-linked outer membrane protein, partial [Flavobacteriaceae bacterium]|nr:SusC/RagA family TonB-linked outer membrane protein [Flavobacteriaceae bacterium]